MRSGTIAFLGGILALQAFKELPHLYWLGVLCLILLIGFYYPRPGFRIISWLLVGFIWAWLNAWWILGQALPHHVEGRDVVVSGFIASIPTQHGRLSRFLFDIETARFKNTQIELPKKGSA